MLKRKRPLWIVAIIFILMLIRLINRVPQVVDSLETLSSPRIQNSVNATHTMRASELATLALPPAIIIRTDMAELYAIFGAAEPDAATATAQAALPTPTPFLFLP